MKNPGLLKVAFTLTAFCIAVSLTSSAQTLKAIADFDGTNGYVANGPLVQGINGNLYGTTQHGGANNAEMCDYGGYSGCGTVFEVTPTGKLTTIYNFCAQSKCADGDVPNALVLASNGNFYGTTGGSTGGGGTHGSGTVFEITPGGKLTTLYNFCSQPYCADGTEPNALIQGADGYLYGTTLLGGSLPTCCGTLFRITPSGKFTTVHKFCPYRDCGGQGPYGALVQASNGNLYGTTYEGGPGREGSIFQMTPTGQVTSIYAFCSLQNCADGYHPNGSLVQGSNGDLFGTTRDGGPNGIAQDTGTVFEVTPSGTLTTRHGFCSTQNGGICIDGAFPQAGVTLGTDGNFYGVTAWGGGGTGNLCSYYPGCGVLFQVTSAGQFTALSDFCMQTNCTDGAIPTMALMQSTNGYFYGVAEDGGTDYNGCNSRDGCGTVFAFSMGLKPFVQANPQAAKVGRTIGVLGNNLTGTSSVTFNGVSASFKVESGTLLLATVPGGATTGPIQVTTPSGVLNSNVNFDVLP